MGKYLMAGHTGAAKFILSKPKEKDLKSWRSVYPAIILLVLLALTLTLTTPANAAPYVYLKQGSLINAISLSDYEPGATSDYTIYFMLTSDWTPNRDMKIDFPYSVYGIGWKSPGPQYIDAGSSTGTPVSLPNTSITFYNAEENNMDTSMLIIRRTSGATLPAGTTVILNFQGVTNPAAAGDYTVSFTNGIDSGSYTLRLPSSPTPSIDFSVSGSGKLEVHNPYTLDPVPAGPCPPGTIIQFYPDTVNGWYWDCWTGAFSGSSANDFWKQAIVVGQTTIGAVFSNTVHVDVSCNSEGGTVSPGTGDFPYESTQYFAATPNPGWHLKKWHFRDWDWGPVPSLEVLLDIGFVKSDSRNVQAVFERNEVSFNIAKTGSGSVTIDPNTTTFSGQTVVQLEATADVSAGWRFSHWDYEVCSGWWGDEIYYESYSSTENRLVFTVDTTGSGTPNTANYLRNGPVNVTAVFTNPDAKKVNLSLDGSGSVSANPGFYNLPDTPVALTAIPLEGKTTFSHWESADISISDPSANPLEFNMPARDIGIRAVFQGNLLP